ncbi:MAG: Enolase [Berkelbacteria bacterium GW2011_GWA2_38_9]|uniref:Enolase n=1 Tax=Berkelbacteria bacterium GW2011_GWA2_38_9 TaxID=1618334 RepID=A0A0G0LHK7_9BACT|nr:MAG: Enolase [Berkelbacteria bacterium GW2011_GWA2_38_9]
MTKKYPITSIEDGLSENDQNSWPELNRQLSDQKIVSIGDDLTVTNPKLIDQFAKNGSISGVIIKMNQIGTISETIEAIKAAKENNLQIIISHRGSETTDTTLVDLAVACGADYIKVGPTRGERVCKYNRLMAIEDLLVKR